MSDRPPPHFRLYHEMWRLVAEKDAEIEQLRTALEIHGIDPDECPHCEGSGRQWQEVDGGENVVGQWYPGSVVGFPHIPQRACPHCAGGGEYE